ncbi:MAG: type II toxin-antitoxin system RelE/ParE family toxin [Acidobacteriia bacterium]|nr:type II toxin-antitoxin system RelE/ParE family toxin [Terriglobia bacterium]
MSRSVSFHPLARQELKEAAHYYESESHGLGQQFLKEIERCLQSVFDYPEAGPVLVGPVRRMLAQRFRWRAVFHQTIENSLPRRNESETASDVLGQTSMGPLDR